MCDPARHFTLTVPQLARRCPPLLNAIFTAAARHVTRLPRYKTSSGVIKIYGIPLPDLNYETALRYHQACLAYLIELSKDPVHVQDETLLAAAVILRYYEELDASYTGQDTETFLHTFQVFVDAQTSMNDVSHRHDTARDLPPTGEPQLLSKDALEYAKSFRHASFRVALRQDISAAFAKQRSLLVPLEAWDALRNFDQAEDAVWTDRLLLFCADVVNFCFGSDAVAGKSQLDRWRELKAFERKWEMNKPLSFSPIHFQEADVIAGEVFPQIWYLSDCHVTGMQFLDLARILLAFYDPTVPRLGPGATAAQRRMSAEVHEIVLRLCGVAQSNRGSQSAMVQAQMAIEICGEHVTNVDEQRAMLELLRELETVHAWPTSRAQAELKKTWLWE